VRKTFSAAIRGGLGIEKATTGAEVIELPRQANAQRRRPRSNG
jgi:hypothetical protein